MRYLHTLVSTTWSILFFADHIALYQRARHTLLRFITPYAGIANHRRCSGRAFGAAITNRDAHAGYFYRKSSILLLIALIRHVSDCVAVIEPSCLARISLAYCSSLLR